MMFKKLIAGIICAALGISLCGCKTARLSEDDTPPASAAYKTVSLSENGRLDITRKDIGNTPMGGAGTWTVFVYMSGSDLEGENGKASEDLDEMLAASTGENVRFIVQTGGSEDWKNDFASAENLERFEIAEGKVAKKAELSLASMADAATLRNFLKWGVENYPAEKMGVILWGHGNGSVGGVCKDDLFDDDYLSLFEINSALAEVSSIMTDKFEFIGFDACYMGTVEVADVLATYAEYMISSQELEPANGWNYTALGDLLGSEPNADWSKIAATLCDSFSDDSSGSKYTDLVTLSVIDLSKTDDIIVSFNDYAYDLFERLKDKDALREFEKYLEGVDHFGSQALYSGYANMADLGDVARAGRGFSDKADEVLNAIDSAIVYKRNGKNHQSACGLTVCYQFEPRGIAELRVLGQTAVSPYFLALTDRKLRDASPVFDDAGYDESGLISLWCGDRNNASNELYGYWSKDPDPGLYMNKNGKSSFVKFSEEFKNKRDGSYSISLEPDTLQYIASVGISVYSSQPDYKYYGLGTKICANADWKNGVFSDKFDGRWFMLPNREPLMITMRETEGDRIAYNAAVQYLEKETNVIFSHDSAFKTRLDGFWKVDENDDMSYTTLKAGDTLSALYVVYTHANDKFKSENGTEHTFDDKPEILYDKLTDGNYYYIIVVRDIWGDEFQSEIVDFSIADGKLVFSDPEQNG